MQLSVDDPTTGYSWRGWRLGMGHILLHSQCWRAGRDTHWPGYTAVSSSNNNLTSTTANNNNMTRLASKTRGQSEECEIMMMLMQ